MTRRIRNRAALAAGFDNDGLPGIVRSGASRSEIWLNQGPDGPPASMNRSTLHVALVTLLLCVSAGASAQQGFDVQRLMPALDGARGFWPVPAGATADRMQWGGSAQAH